MANINKYLKALLNPAGGHQGGHKAHQAGNQLFTVFYLKFVPIITSSKFCFSRLLSYCSMLSFVFLLYFIHVTPGYFVHDAVEYWELNLR